MFLQYIMKLTIVNNNHIFAKKEDTKLKRVNKVLIVLCMIAIVLSSFMLVGCDKDAGKNNGDNDGNNGGTNTGTNSNTNTDISTYVRVDADGNETSDGKYILFGSYPQSKVTDKTVSAALTEAAGALPTKESDGNWISYGYDIVFSVVAGDGAAEKPVNVVASRTIKSYSWYIDREYNGARYRGIYFLDYRPFTYLDCGEIAESMFSSEEEMNEWLDSITQEWMEENWIIPTEENALQARNGYAKGSVYWFKYEPIKWRILEEKDGKAFLMSDTALYSREMDDIINYNHKKITEDDWYYYCNYAASDLRKWLNGSFYNDAFSDGQKDMIAVTTVSNGKDSYWDEDYGMYWCEDTEDKVFLLSEKEAIDAKYGFTAGDDPFETKDTARRLQASDYALGNGCFSGIHENSGYNGQVEYGVEEGCYWRLRSLGGEISDGVVVTPDGDFYFEDTGNFETYYGIAPVIWLNL